MHEDAATDCVRRAKRNIINARSYQCTSFTILNNLNVLDKPMTPL